jgi:hypothetical protein
MIPPSVYLRLALDPIRLAVLGTAAVEPVDAAALAGRLGVDVRKVRREVGRLREAGLLTEDLSLDREVLRTVASAMPHDLPMDPALLEGPWTDEEAEVLGRFFAGSRLTQIPTRGSKRRLVLERLAQEFEPGLRYSEREINLTLEAFHPDYVSLRRYMVDEGLLTRSEGVYWRSGGRT